MSSNKPKEIPEGFAWCGKHQTLHPVADFGSSKKSKNGLRNYCKAADSGASKESKARNGKPEEKLAKKLEAAVALLMGYGYVVTAPVVEEVEAEAAPEAEAVAEEPAKPRKSGK